MKTIAIIQIRLRSQRLPLKSVRPLADTNILSIIIERLKMVSDINCIWIASGTKSYNSKIEEYTPGDVDIFYGEENDVLSRYITIGKNESTDYIIRVNGDNPFFDYSRTAQHIRLANQNGYDYLSVHGMPLGLRTEMIKRQALECIYEKSLEGKYKEHITLYIREHPDEFNVYIEEEGIASKYPDIRLTIDEERDFLMLSELICSYPSVKTMDAKEIVRLMASNPSITKINSPVLQKTT